MGIWDRLRSWWRGDDSAAARSITSVADVRADVSAGGVIGGMLIGRPGDAALMRSYGENVWLHAVVHRRGEALAGIEWTLHKLTAKAKGRGFTTRGAMRHARHKLEAKRPYDRVFHQRDLIDELIAEELVEELFDHPLLDLLDRPMQPVPELGLHGLSGHELWELESNHMDLVGEGVLMKEREGKRVVGLIPMVPLQLSRAPTVQQPTYGFRTTSGRAFDVVFEDVIWFKQRDPAQPFVGRGVGTARALALETQIDKYAAQTSASRFANRNAPEAILSLEGNVSPAEVDKFTDELDGKHRGVERAGMMHVVKGKVTVSEVGQTMVESQQVQHRVFGRDTHMQGFGMPPEIGGVLSNANKSTIVASRSHMAVFSTQPMARRFCDRLQIDLVEPDFGDDLILGFRSMEPDDEEFRAGVMKAMPGLVRKNEGRKIMGLPPDPEGNVWYAQPGAGSVVPVEGGSGTPSDEPKKKKDPAVVDDPPPKENDNAG